MFRLTHTMWVYQASGGLAKAIAQVCVHWSCAAWSCAAWSCAACCCLAHGKLYFFEPMMQVGLAQRGPGGMESSVPI